MERLRQHAVGDACDSCSYILVRNGDLIDLSAHCGQR